MSSLVIWIFLLVVINSSLIYFYVRKTKDILIISEFGIEFIFSVLIIDTVSDSTLFTSLIHGLIIVLISILFVIFRKIL
ncbi:hypothetical protein [uncultured Parvimonas sp.]|uniref:hypothetical protein n=1 Tax=uncultured Parvimonas sp. TaxID=747372 RepID=UPI0028D193D0|nr:hypothetical protein [uncultured Parvimonas sp.]